MERGCLLLYNAFPAYGIVLGDVLGFLGGIVSFIGGVLATLQGAYTR